MPASFTASRDRSAVDPGALAFLEALEAREAVDEKALRSFIFEVSAGRPRGVIDATDLEIRTDPPKEDDWAPRRRRRRRKTEAGSVESKKPVSRSTEGSTTDDDKSSESFLSNGSHVSVTESTPDSSNSRGLTARRRGAERARQSQGRRAVSPRLRRARRRRQALSANVVGIGFNCLVVVVLMTGKLPGVEPLHELLWATAPTVEEIDFTDVNFEAADEDRPTDGEREAPEQLVDPGMAAFGELETRAALAALSTDGDMAAGTLGGELGAVFGERGAGLATFDSGLGEAPIAKFFGQEIEGRRIVFVLDNSGSMQGGRLETVIAELLRCVESLRPEQEFYVIFHSDMVYPLFYPDPVDRYIRPTPSNKRALARWLDTVELCLGDSVDEALAIAAMIQPDTVFLLSDGRIQSQKTLRYLLDSRSRSFPIHTFAVGMGSSVAGRRNLADVAAANGGEFRETEIPDEMRDLAREKLRPYHSERPGPVWGRMVKPFRPRG
jgi:hypothetical protein